jgi:hypothetical protein
LWHPSNTAAVSTASAAWSSITATMHAALVAVWCGRNVRRAVERAVAGRAVRGVTSSSPCVEREEGREVEGEEHQKAVAEGGLTRGCELTLSDAEQGSLTFLTPYWRRRFKIARRTKFGVFDIRSERNKQERQARREVTCFKARSWLPYGN